MSQVGRDQRTLYEGWKYFILSATICCFLIGIQAQAQSGKQEERFEEVSYISEGISISARLWLPAGEAPFPAMVIVHGSGPSAKESAEPMAIHFAKLGFAVLTHDKRGVGKSGGVYEAKDNVTEKNLTLLAKDVSAGIDYLKRRPEIDKDRIGLYGWSQAGWIIPLVASMQKNIGFTLLISGPTVSVGEEYHYSQMAAEGDFSDTNRVNISTKLKALGPSYFDPLPYLKEMKMPTLYVFGGMDRSIPVSESIAIINELNQNGGNIQYRVFENASHFITINKELVEDYYTVQDDFLQMNVLLNK